MYAFLKKMTLKICNPPQIRSQKSSILLKFWPKNLGPAQILTPKRWHFPCMLHMGSYHPPPLKTLPPENGRVFSFIELQGVYSWMIYWIWELTSGSCLWRVFKSKANVCLTNERPGDSIFLRSVSERTGFNSDDLDEIPLGEEFSHVEKVILETTIDNIRLYVPAVQVTLRPCSYEVGQPGMPDQPTFIGSRHNYR